VELDSRLDLLDSGVVSAGGLVRVVQALIQQARQGRSLDVVRAEQTRFFTADLVRDCPPGDSRRGQALLLAIVAGVVVNEQTGKENDLDNLIIHLAALLETPLDPDASVGGVSRSLL
jgi:hypothetical protein